MFDSESSSDGGWISWFCDLEGHEFFVEVSSGCFLLYFRLMPSTLETRLIYTVWRKKYPGSSKWVFGQLFSEAMKMILSRESPDSEDLNDQG